jgi:hypothetical protein
MLRHTCCVSIFQIEHLLRLHQSTHTILYVFTITPLAMEACMISKFDDGCVYQHATMRWQHLVMGYQEHQYHLIAEFLRR